MSAPPEPERFEPAASARGTRLALVFGNHAPGGRCPWYAAGRCHHCDIGAGEGRAFTAGENLARLEWFAGHYAPVLPAVAHLVLYDSGSTLNERELPWAVLARLLAFARALPRVRTVSLDTREAFVTREALTRAAGALGERVQVRACLGVESADDALRDGALEKAMPRAAIERAFAAAGAVGRALGPARVGLDVNVLVGGPGSTSIAADAVATARWAFELGRAHEVPVDLNLHAYYPSARGRARFPSHPRCPVAEVAGAAAAIASLRAEVAPLAALFVGWQDEGHDGEPALRRRELATARGAFEAFNSTQDPRALASVTAPTSP